MNRVEIENWIADDPDPKTASELQKLLDANDEITLNKLFNGFLTFGTAGLRGPIAPGPSGINRAVIGRTAAAIAQYMKQRGLTSVVIGRDARYGSEDFTRESAEIFSGAGMQVSVLPRPLPTPVLAHAIKQLGAHVGIMVTASHNPPMDNGYKVYLNAEVDGINYQGSQIITPTDKLISAEIDNISALKSQPRSNNWHVLNDEIFNDYVARTAAIGKTPGNLKIVYSAMHGVGLETVQAVFKKAGFKQPILVEEQAQPDPNFPTVSFPNPEEPGAIDLSLAKAKFVGADLVIANDPDADRCAAAIIDPKFGWRMLKGDELGILLGDWIARTNDGNYANSIVSSTGLSKICRHYGRNFQETLTGFKYLAQIPNLAFAYEEAIGYSVDSATVSDKDGVSAAIALAQLAEELAAKGQTIYDRLQEIWKIIGLHATEQISIRVENINLVGKVLDKFRTHPPKEIAGFAVTAIDDLAKPTSGLPPTDGLRIWLGDIRVIVRPSGTEPKLKCYLEVISLTEEQALEKLATLRGPLKELLNQAGGL
jgi:phosphomannomutase